jgi:hypothetical protein
MSPMTLGLKVRQPTVAPHNIALLWATRTTAIMAFAELVALQTPRKIKNRHHHKKHLAILIEERSHPKVLASPRLCNRGVFFAKKWAKDLP